MPTYEYECPKGHRFDLFQRMSDEPVAKCPECGAKASRKISGGAGFLFKGEGFYITDYRSDDYRKKASAEKGDSGGASAGGSSKEGGSSKGGSSKEGSATPSGSKASTEPSD